VSTPASKRSSGTTPQLDRHLPIIDAAKHHGSKLLMATPQESKCSTDEPVEGNPLAHPLPRLNRRRAPTACSEDEPHGHLLPTLSQCRPNRLHLALMATSCRGCHLRRGLLVTEDRSIPGLAVESRGGQVDSTRRVTTPSTSSPAVLGGQLVGRDLTLRGGRGRHRNVGRPDRH